MTGNNWGVCPDGVGRVGCGPQVQYNIILYSFPVLKDFYFKRAHTKNDTAAIRICPLIF